MKCKRFEEKSLSEASIRRGARCSGDSPAISVTLDARFINYDFKPTVPAGKKGKRQRQRGEVGPQVLRPQTRGYRRQISTGRSYLSLDLVARLHYPDTYNALRRASPSLPRCRLADAVAVARNIRLPALGRLSNKAISKIRQRHGGLCPFASLPPPSATLPRSLQRSRWSSLSETLTGAKVVAEDSAELTASGNIYALRKGPRCPVCTFPARRKGPL